MIQFARAWMPELPQHGCGRRKSVHAPHQIVSPGGVRQRNITPRREADRSPVLPLGLHRRGHPRRVGERARRPPRHRHKPRKRNLHPVNLYPSSTRDYRTKFYEYEAAGVGEYWIIDPLSRRLEAYSLKRGKYVEIQNDEATIPSNVIAGFDLKHEWLFPRLPATFDVLKELGVL